jgi:hypothetical protein
VLSTIGNPVPTVQRLGISVLHQANKWLASVIRKCQDKGGPVNNQVCTNVIAPPYGSIIGAANPATVSRTRTIARSSRHATEVVDAILDATFVGKRKVSTLHSATLLVQVSGLDRIGKDECRVDL